MKPNTAQNVLLFLSIFMLIFTSYLSSQLNRRNEELKESMSNFNRVVETASKCQADRLELVQEINKLSGMANSCADSLESAVRTLKKYVREK